MMADRRRSHDTRNNAGKCYTKFFDDEINDRRMRSSPKKGESPKKKGSTSTSRNATAKDYVAEEEDIIKHVDLLKSESCESEAESSKRKFSSPEGNSEPTQEVQNKKLKMSSEKDQMFELFQPWALKTYGDQAKTKTITLKKKFRILKALDGKEQNNPDSSKFRFWVKSKGFTTRIPENFAKCEVNQDEDAQTDHVDLYVASTTKDFGERTYRKVAVVEEFFNIIYNVHVELGGRNGRHAGQKRTYRIITETYAFLPREAVTKFLSGCPACKKNLRPFSPSRFEEQFTESSSEFEALNYSSQNESSVDSTKLEGVKLINPTKEDSLQIRLNSPKLENTKAEHSESPSSNADRSSLKNRAHEVKSEPGLKVENCTLKVHDFWNKSNQNHSKTDDNILNYYQFLKKFYAHPETGSWTSPEANYLLSRHKFHENRKIPSPTNIGSKIPSLPSGRSSPFIKVAKRDEYPDSTIDLTIKPIEKLAKRININIENSINPSHSDTTSDISTSSRSNSGIFINSVDVSINMSNNMNELRISCKTTPPKKRYSVYKPDPVQTTENKDEKCAINLSKEFNIVETKCDNKKELIDMSVDKDTRQSFPVDLRMVKPITSTYLKMTRSLGLSDEDALQIDDLETLPTTGTESIPDQSSEESYAGLMKETDKLKLMLLAWNYQNSNAARNGSDAPDLGVVGGLWAQYQNALALNTKQSSVSPVHRPEQSSPIENLDETNSSGQKDEDDGSEDDSDDKLDQNAQDPERLKAFNMFVRLFVDENLDRMIPISKQPKEKIQAIIDSCARQFPEFCERSRKRIRTYLKSCRRNKKAREGWDNTSRPTPAHLTSVQAEQILAIACENESMNAKRMRVGLDPISQAMPLPSGTANSIETIAPSASYPNFRTTPNSSANTTESDTTTPSTTAQTVNTARSSPLSLNSSGNEAKPLTVASSITTNTQVSSPLYRPADFASPSSTSSPYSSRPQTYPPFFSNASSTVATPTDLSMKQHQQQQPSQTLPPAGASPTPRPPIVTHKLSTNEITAARQVITAYRESAAFLLRTADQVEQLLLQQQ